MLAFALKAMFFELQELIQTQKGKTNHGIVGTYMKIGQTGRYLESRRAESPEVLRTTIPPALRSREARTADRAHDSATLHGRLSSEAISSKCETYGMVFSAIRQATPHMSVDSLPLATVISGCTYLRSSRERPLGDRYPLQSHQTT